MIKNYITVIELHGQLKFKYYLPELFDL